MTVLKIVNVTTGELDETAIVKAGVVIWAPGVEQHNARAGLVRGDLRVVAEVDGDPTGAGDEIRETGAHWDGGDAWVIDREFAALTAEQLAARKGEAIVQIDNQAEAARLTYITGGSGQALVYQRKSDQAKACLAAYDAQNPPPAGTYPSLEAEVGITGADVIEVATVVKGLEEAWGAVADSIETIRLGAKAAIEDPATTTAAQIQAILAAIAWPQPNA